jgi:hypothetical protein
MNAQKSFREILGAAPIDLQPCPEPSFQSEPEPDSRSNKKNTRLKKQIKNATSVAQEILDCATFKPEPTGPLTFESMNEGNLYLVKRKEYHIFPPRNLKAKWFLCLCENKKIYQENNVLVRMMTDNGMDTYSHEYNITFAPGVFRRIPRDLLSNYSKYKKEIFLVYYDQGKYDCDHDEYF